MRIMRNVLWGMVFIIVGVVLGINALGIAHINIFFRGWWTLFIIIPSFIDLFKERDKVGSLVGIFIGVILLLICRGLFDFEVAWKLFIPCILVIIGLSLLFKSVICNKVAREIKKLSKIKHKKDEYYATFSEEKINFDGEKFDGCSLSSTFGKIECNLSDSIITEDAIITASSVFGNITIKLPDDVNVKIKSNSIFGGVTDKRKNNKKADKTVYIDATCLFGGVDIR